MHHVRLVSRMAKTTQTDLTMAYDVGDLSHQDWAEMVQTCRSCDWAEKCSGWLEGQETVDDAPKPCLNRARLKSLKAVAAQPVSGSV